MIETITRFVSVQPGTTAAPVRIETQRAEWVEVLNDGGRPVTLHIGGQRYVVHSGERFPVGRNEDFGVAEITSADGIVMNESIAATSRVHLLLMDAQTALIRASSSPARPITHTRSTQVTVVTGADRLVTRQVGNVRTTILAPSTNGQNVTISHSDATGANVVTLVPGASVLWYGPIHAQCPVANQTLELIEELIEAL